MCILKDHREYIDLTDECATDKHLWPKGTICNHGRFYATRFGRTQIRKKQK